MKKIKKTCLYALVASTFAATFFVELGSKSIIAEAGARTLLSDTGTGTETDTGTGTGALGTMRPILTRFTKIVNGETVTDHWGTCCGSGDTICTPVACP